MNQCTERQIGRQTNCPVISTSPGQCSMRGKKEFNRLVLRMNFYSHLRPADRTGIRRDQNHDTKRDPVPGKNGEVVIADETQQTADGN